MQTTQSLSSSDEKLKERVSVVIHRLEEGEWMLVSRCRRRLSSSARRLAVR